MPVADPKFTLEFPYRRSLGPVVGAFFTGLRDGKILGSRTRGGRVLVPPLEYDPETGASVQPGLVDVADTGTVAEWAWVTEPLRKHPLQKPFAWVLVQLDGADTKMLHALDAASIDHVKAGMRVRARWRDERIGSITDIECFEADDGTAKAASNGETSDADPVQFLQSVIGLDYAIRPSPLQRKFSAGISEGHIVGHKCPQCGLVYVPPKGYCPLCCVVTDASHETEVKDTGVVTSFTVVTPIQYPGQEETEEYVVASVLLDGSDSTIGQQRIEGIAHNEVRSGMRVRAEWLPEAERTDDGGMWGFGFGNAIKHFVPTGEPDAPESHFREHVF
jgi:uncharacterized OB-fold protein